MTAQDEATEDDRELLRQAIKVADDAVLHGNHPFGALLTDSDGQVVLTAENTVVTDDDVTGHAETNLVRQASRTIGRTGLADYTLYTSCEPCAMCSGAIYWAGIHRVVYALAETSLLALTGAHAENPTLKLPAGRYSRAGSAPPSLSVRSSRKRPPKHTTPSGAEGPARPSDTAF